MTLFRTMTARIGAALFLTIALLTTGGCDNKEKVLDIETPGGEVEVERDRDTGETDVEVNSEEE